MSTQHISSSQTVMNSVINQSTADNAATPDNLTTDTKQSRASNTTESSKYHLKSDWDIFGDDDEFIQALETDGSTWLAVSGTQQMQDNDQHKTRIENPLLENSNVVVDDTASAQHSQTALADVDDSQSDALLVSDHYADLPSSPGFSLDELPIFSKQKTVDADGQPHETADLSDTANLASGIAHNEDMGMADSDVYRVRDKHMTDEDVAEALDCQFTQQMDMLDTLDSASLSAQPLSSFNVSDIEPSTVDSGQSSDTSAPASRFKLSLRQRNAIQLHPFTIEQANFQYLISRSSMKGKIKAAVSTQIADSQDTEFTISDTQQVDVTTDELQASQMHPEGPRKSASKSKLKKTSLPSKSNKRAKHRAKGSNIANTTFDDIASPVCDKYGLDKLILPTVATGASRKEKPKIITFQKKKGSKKDKSVVRKFLPSSSTSRTKDIFDFDAQPRSSFNFAASSSDLRATSPDPDDYLRQQMQDMNADVDFNNYGSDMDDDEADAVDADNEETIKRRFRVKKHAILDSSDEEEDMEDDEEEEESPPERELTEAELDAIFSFPGTSALTPKSSRITGKRLTRPSSEDGVVSIVEDAFEHREHKRQRIGLQDVLKKKKTLKSILPASFLKIYQKELLEEDRLRKAPKKRTVSTNASKSNTATTSSNTRHASSCSTSRADPDVFAAFLDSQSEGSGDDSDDMQDAYPTLDDYVTMMDYATQIPNTQQHQAGSATPTGDNTDFFESSAAHSSKRTLKQTQLNAGISSRAGSPSPLSRQHPQSVYPVEEPIEDNRIQRYHQGTSSRKWTTKAKKLVKRAPRSSIAIKRPADGPKKPSSIPIRDNPAPKKRRKKVKRTRDDIYCHALNSYRAWNDRSGQAPDNNGRAYFQRSVDTPRMAFDDIYVGTRQYVRYANESLHGDRFNELFDQQQNEHIKEKLNVLIIHTLPNVISRVRHLQDYDLRRISGLKDTVYLHHRLLTPLLSAIPNLKSAYKHLQDNYVDLILFDKHLLWRNVVPENEWLLAHLFYKVSGDIVKICKEKFPLDDKELPGHDHFYTFVSVCLTQWIPLHPYEDRVQLTELFMRYIRYLGQFVPRLVEECNTGDLTWRPIVKLMVYILDWTCRLHHLGVHQIDWSVTQCTKSLIDILVFIGFGEIKSCTKDYLAEAWICLLQIMSVSSKTSGFYFDEQVFLDQMTDSIKKKSKDLGVYEFDKRKTTRLWAETLNFVIEQYMLL
ncbi:uncharacterized protein ATC70_010856 [Mucor velutinosus]|uniref:Uncharacterized protein n=1 Tax=Mucor velutinosus TaxID=708070 RepID=A0AAN7DF02_9FUNG|nr:hypothetical protein ATC70_010856 [Mucor velutinosus]